MEDSGLISFSLESLGKMELLPKEVSHSFGGLFFAKIDWDLDKKVEMLRYPCRINA